MFQIFNQNSVLKDAHNRQIKDLRVSVTDRCNFRCFYCLPHGEPPAAPKAQMLTYEEITRACEIFTSLGVEKLRLTGGEPLMRRDIETLVYKLAKLNGVEDLALTTNAYFLPDRAQALKDAGLNRVTISLDSLNRERFRIMTGVDVLDKVLRGIEAAEKAGLTPIKINSVIVRGHNEREVANMAQFARETGASMRFIEYMPLDSGHAWSWDKVVSGKEIRERIETVFPLTPVYKNGQPLDSETASRFTFTDNAPGEIGIIAPVTQAFCGACSRIRLTADGQIRTCLFSKTEHSLRDVLRTTDDNTTVINFIRQVVDKKEAGHNINAPTFVQPARTMSLIGG